MSVDGAQRRLITEVHPAFLLPEPSDLKLCQRGARESRCFFLSEWTSWEIKRSLYASSRLSLHLEMEFLPTLLVER